MENDPDARNDGSDGVEFMPVQREGRYPARQNKVQDRTMMTLVDRRGFVTGAVLAGGVAALPTDAFAASRHELIYAGMHGGHIHVARFNAMTGDIRMIGPIAENKRPIWVLCHPTLPSMQRPVATARGRAAFRRFGSIQRPARLRRLPMPCRSCRSTTAPVSWHRPTKCLQRQARCMSC
jgi:hypothetical protein